jgi:exopolysaccharide production protein ExoQ
MRPGSQVRRTFVAANGADGAVGEDAGADSIIRTPLWVLAGQLGVVVIVLGGFAAFQDLRPRMLIAMWILTAGAMLLLGPARQVERVIVSFAVAAYLAWWSLSFVWTYQEWVFLRDTQYTFPLIAAFVCFATLLPYRAFTRALLTAAYLGLVWTLVFTALSPGEGMHHTDGTPGWPGPFGHKNGLAMFVIFAGATVASFERRWLPKVTAISLCVALVLLAQSTTGLVVGASLATFAWFLGQVAHAPREFRGRLLALGSLLGTAFAMLAVMTLPVLTGLAGKDPTLSRRTEIWAGVIEVVQRRPLTGYGVGGAWINHSAEPTRTILRDLGFLVYQAHNGFLEIMLQLGLVGLALFMVLLLATARSSLAVADLDPIWFRYSMLIVALVVVSSLSEATTFGIYLALICAFHSLSLRLGPSPDPRPNPCPRPRPPGEDPGLPAGIASGAAGRRGGFEAIAAGWRCGDTTSRCSGWTALARSAIPLSPGWYGSARSLPSVAVGALRARTHDL